MEILFLIIVVVLLILSISWWKVQPFLALLVFGLLYSIGSGSFCVFHINSSFFWLLNRLHNVAPAILFRTYTVQSLCMGLGGLAVVFGAL